MILRKGSIPDQAPLKAMDDFPFFFYVTPAVLALFESVAFYLERSSRIGITK